MNWDSKIAATVKSVPPSGIRKFFDLASTMEGVISLGVGEPDYAAPDKVIDACIESLKNKETSYTSNLGLMKLREEIAALFHRRYHVDYNPANEIVVTVGVSEAISIAMTALLNPGDEVLIPDPAYVAYPACVRFAGGVPVLVPTWERMTSSSPWKNWKRKSPRRPRSCSSGIRITPPARSWTRLRWKPLQNLPRPTT